MQDYKPPTSYHADSMRWGKNQGCSFITGSVRDWPARYQCRIPAEQGCSFDNRMAAVCSMATSVDTAETADSNVYSRTQGLYGLSEQVDGACTAGSRCGIPAVYQVRSSTPPPPLLHPTQHPPPS
jgi:hypothetical protein